MNYYQGQGGLGHDRIILKHTVNTAHVETKSDERLGS